MGRNFVKELMNMVSGEGEGRGGEGEGISWPANEFLTSEKKMLFIKLFDLFLKVIIFSICAVE